ncbi:hypothetical protein [Staphylococcus aureus]|nr:hypothetical protein [Staphylococcus aureus]MCR6086803.1 hypothetical protein [Staphylococcus aureus]
MFLKFSVLEQNGIKIGIKKATLMIECDGR